MIPISCQNDAKVFYTDEDGIKYTFKAMSGLLEDEFDRLSSSEVIKTSKNDEYSKMTKDFFDKVLLSVDLNGKGTISVPNLSMFFNYKERAKILNNYWFNANTISDEEKKS
jgi:hypothetical protein